MSACASFPRVQERARAVRLFEPDEVATVIDLFAPLTQVRLRAASSVRGFDWARIAAAVTLTTGVFLAGAALVAEPRRPPLTRVHPAAVTPVERVSPAPPAPAIVAVVIAPRPPGPTAVLAALNRRALSAYGRGEPGAALAALSRGLRLCQRPVLAWHHLCARTHLNTGVVLAGARQQSALATRHFRIARAIRPAITLPARFDARGIAEAFEGARR